MRGTYASALNSDFVVIVAHFLPLIKNACWAVLLGTILRRHFSLSVVNAPL